MVTVCAWCGAVLRHSTDVYARVSHALCHDCLEDALAALLAVDAAQPRRERVLPDPVPSADENDQCGAAGC